MLKKVLIFKKSIIFLSKKLRILNISSIFVSTKGVKDMAQARKYRIGRSASGWGIWESATGNKVMSCYSHYHAVESLYNLMGWRWNPAKYRG